MKQIAKIARELKQEFAGQYNYYYQSVTIYLDNKRGELYAQYWAQGESWISKPNRLIELCSFGAAYGNWGRVYGDTKNWSITKKVIAEAIAESDANLPEWLQKEVEYYMNKQTN